MMPKIEFIEEGHIYKVDGVIRPSVTTIIHDCVPIYDKAFKEWHSQRGKAVHFACQLLEEGRLDWNTVHPLIFPYVKAWEQYLLDTGAKSVAMELMGYNKDLIYVGTLDRIMIINGVTEITDIKSGNSVTADVQTAAYNMMLENPCHKRASISLTKDGKYKRRVYKEEKDYATFTGMCSTYYYKRSKNL